MTRDDKDPNVLKDREMTAQESQGSAGPIPYGYAYGRGSGPSETLDTADQEVRYLMKQTITAKENRILQAQQEMQEAHYLRALLDALPTKMSHDAAMGLKLLIRSFGNTLLRY